ncbi:MAG: SsrA-binding protein SmpB [Candidatus Izemoplasmatales bacterium]
MKVLAHNKKVQHDYQILDTFEFGIVLKGTEIKSIKQGKFSINESYVTISKNHELYIINMHISKYDHGSIFNHEEKRKKKLLAHKHTIEKLEMKLKLEGLTLVPKRVYLKDGLCKVEVVLAKGKKLYDKRQSKKREDAEKRIEKALY